MSIIDKTYSRKKQLAINLISQIIAYVVSIGVSFFITPYITAKLGKDVYGFVGMAYQVTSYITIFTISLNGMLNIFVSTKYHQGKMKDAAELFNSILEIDVIAAAILSVGLGLVVVFLQFLLDVPAGSLGDIKFLWGLIFGTFVLNLAIGPFSAGTYIKNRLDLTGIWSIEGNLMRGVLLMALYFLLPAKVWYIGFASFVSGIFLNIMNISTFRRLVPEIRIHWAKISWRAVKELFLVGIWNAVGQLNYVLNNGLDLLIANIALNALEMGYLSYAQTVPIQIVSLLTTIQSSFAPDLTKSYAKGETDRFIEDIESAIKICGFLGSVPILGFIVFGRDFYHLWLPTLTHAEVIKINILSCLILLPNVFGVYISPLNNVNSITRNIKIPAIVSFGIGIANVIVELILVNTTNLGVYAIEIVTAVLLTAQTLIFLPLYAAWNLKVKWSTFYKPLRRGMAATAAVLAIYAGIYRAVHINGWFSLIAVCLVAGIIGYIVNYFVILDSADKLLVRQKIRAKLHRS